MSPQYKRIFHASFIIVFTVGLYGCSEKPVSAEREGVNIRIAAIDIRPRFAWGATIADFDNDGALDFFIGGHGFKGDSIYYRRGDIYTASTFVFPPGKDRHACASADVNGDGWLDLYCTTGADQGQSLNPNELWMGVNGTDFRRVHRRFGAEDPTGRGRLTSFLNFNGDDKPDLFVSVWGKRSDDALNESSIYINRGARFERIATSANGMKGAGCQAVADINGDNLDDLAVCLGVGDWRILVNYAGKEFKEFKPLISEHTRPDLKEVQWVDLKFAEFNDDNLQDLITLSASGDIEIRLGSPDTVGYPAVDRRISTQAIGDSTASNIFAANLALSDLDRDGHIDVYVTRRIGPGKDSLGGDAPDIVLFGPDFGSHLTIPMAAAGQGYRTYALDNSFLRLNMGERWQGSVEIISAGEQPR